MGTRNEKREGVTEILKANEVSTGGLVLNEFGKGIPVSQVILRVPHLDYVILYAAVFGIPFMITKDWRFN